MLNNPSSKSFNTSDLDKKSSEYSDSGDSDKFGDSNEFSDSGDSDKFDDSNEFSDSGDSDEFVDSNEFSDSGDSDKSIDSNEFFDSGEFGGKSETSHESTYMYLNDNPLSKNFGDFIDTSKTYTIHICIFKVKLGYKYPFLQFLIENSSSSFPCIHDFTCRELTDQNDCNTFFMNTCFSEVIDFLNIHSTFNHEMSENMYKGFVQQDASNIFAVFECTDETEFTSSNKSQWNILDDMISPITKTFFIKQSFMTEILKYDGSILPQPFLVYICQKDLLHNYPISAQEKYIIDQTINHDFFGDSYFFTSSPIKDDGTLQKYAAFIEKVRYIVNDIHHLENYQKKIFFNNNSLYDIITIYFHQNSVQYWCIKNSNNFTRI